LDEGKEPVRPLLSAKMRESRFGRRKMLLGNSPCNPQSTSESNVKEEDKFVKELGATKDISIQSK
jgi:hypothetical protein